MDDFYFSLNMLLLYLKSLVKVVDYIFSSRWYSDLFNRVICTILPLCMTSFNLNLVLIYSCLFVVWPRYLPRNYGHIREVAFGEREN